MPVTKQKWRNIEDFYIKILIKDGYNQECAENLGFYISQLVEDALPLLEIAKEDHEIQNIDIEEIMEKVHMLFNNYNVIVSGYKLLMSRENK